MQEHFGDKKRFLDGFKLSSAYFKLVKYVEEHGLISNVKLCVPQIVIEEMKEHLFKDFISNRQSIKDKIEEYKKIFGDLLEVDYAIKINEADYKKYILESIENLRQSSGNLFIVVEYPECFPKMIENALRTVKPFSNAKSNTGKNKEYTDAGFKDALMIESILNHCDMENEKVILFSKDDDFKDIVNNSNFEIAKELDKVIEILDKTYKINPVLEVKSRIEDRYHRELLLSFADCIFDEAVSDFKINDMEESENGQFLINQECIINETNYKFKYFYDLVANEIIDCSYEITND